MDLINISSLELVKMRQQFQQVLDYGDSYFPSDLAKKNLNEVLDEMRSRIK